MELLYVVVVVLGLIVECVRYVNSDRVTPENIFGRVLIILIWPLALFLAIIVVAIYVTVCAAVYPLRVFKWVHKKKTFKKPSFLIGFESRSH